MVLKICIYDVNNKDKQGKKFYFKTGFIFNMFTVHEAFSKCYLDLSERINLNNIYKKCDNNNRCVDEKYLNFITLKKCKKYSKNNLRNKMHGQ